LLWLVAIITLGWTFFSIHSTSTTVASITFSHHSPSPLLRHPTNFRLAERTLQPITSPFFEQKYLWENYWQLINLIKINLFKELTWQVGQFIASSLSIKFCSSFLVSFVSFTSLFKWSWYCLQFKPSWIAWNQTFKIKFHKLIHLKALIYSTCDAIHNCANWTLEDIGCIFKNAPSFTIWRFAMKCIRNLIFG
jgi:hypothetical protein